MKKPANYLLVSIGLMMAISACKTNLGGEKIIAIDVANIDTSVRPQDDFYTYANGLWLKNNPIPSTETRWGAFSILQDETNKKLKVLLDESAANTAAAKGSNEQKVGDFYASGMDSLAIEKAGLSPLKNDLTAIQSIQNINDLLNQTSILQKKGVSALYSFYVYQDMKISSAYIPYADQGGLSLPDRDYYTKTDARSEEIRKQFRIHLVKMFTMMGDDQASATANAETIIRLETQLAEASMTRVEMRDPYATYNKMSVADANKITKNINWNTVISKAGITNVNEMIVSQPKFFTALDNMLRAEKIDAWKTYLRWHLVSGFAGNLNQGFVAESFAFNGTVMNGAKEMRPRWKRVLGDINGGIGEALGEVYVKRYFPEEAKKRCLEMVNNMQIVYRERIEKLDWMGDSTKKQAIEKLAVFIKKIGYPDKFKDYSKLTISRASYVQNIMAANEFAFEEMINKYGKPVDKTEWAMTPHTINAYYNPSINEIVFPAGILQFPFFNPSVDDAINYGGIGAVIGHEMTHGFDDQGCQFDKEGNLKNWWTEQDNNKFKAKTKMLVDQYSAYTVLDNVHVNGELTLGENIADVGGINIAYDAFKRTAQGKSNEKIDGFTADQRFFLSWAQVWRQNITDENLNQRIVTDPHSPGKYRTNGPLTNMPEFYEAFGIKQGDKMFRPATDRVKVW
jgi:putative endopeptidase